jgi:hypothetical protein
MTRKIKVLIGFNIDTIAVVLIGGLCLSAILIVHMWLRRRNALLWMLFWTVVLLVPYVGPALYWAFYKPPPPRRKEDQLTDNKVSIQ